MTLKKFLASGLVALAGLSLVGTVAFAQNGSQDNSVKAPKNSVSINGEGHINLVGKVTALSGSTVSVASWLGTWTVNVSANTAFLPSTSSLANIKVNDTVKVNGIVGSAMSVNATRIHVPSANVHTKVLTGTVSNMNAAAGTFSLATEHSGTVSIATNANTKIFLQGNASALSGVAQGSKATVVGNFDASASTMTALVIRVPAVEIKKDGLKKEFKEFKQGILQRLNLKAFLKHTN